MDKNVLTKLGILSLLFSCSKSSLSHEMLNEGSAMGMVVFDQIAQKIVSCKKTWKMDVVHMDLFHD